MATKPNKSNNSSNKQEPVVDNSPSNDSELEAMRAEIERLRQEKETIKADLEKERATKELQNQPIREYYADNGMLIRDY